MAEVPCKINDLIENSLKLINTQVGRDKVPLQLFTNLSLDLQICAILPQVYLAHYRSKWPSKLGYQREIRKTNG